MEIITKSQLREARSSFVEKHSHTEFRNAVNESRVSSQKAGQITIFLSHKHADREYLEDAIALLKNQGVLTYVDWMDEQMPAKTSGETATRLKKKIRECRKFILLATEDAIGSRWCNWELGLGDAAKYLEHIALLPVKNDNREWTGSEYLQIYPAIGYKYSWSNKYVEIVYPNGNTIDLQKWLTT